MANRDERSEGEKKLDEALEQVMEEAERERRRRRRAQAEERRRISAKIDLEEATKKPTESESSGGDAVRSSGYTDKQVREYFEKKFMPLPSTEVQLHRPIYNEVWAEIKQHRGWYFLAFLLGGLPVGIGTIWPTLTRETVPEW